MSRQLRLGLVAVVLGGAAACGTSDEVLLGRAQLAKNETECDTGRCDDAGLPFPTEPVQVAESGRCDVELSGQLPLALQVSDLQQRLCAGVSGCQANLRQVVPTADGGAWVRAGVLVLVPGLPTTRANLTTWLGHFDASGLLVGQATTEGDGLQLAVDDRSHAWLLTASPHQLVRFDGGAQPLGAAVLAPEAADTLAAYPGHGVAVAGGGAITLLDYEAQPIWTRRPRAVAYTHSALVVGLDGPALLTREPRASNYHGLAIDAFDAHGNARWSAAASIHGVANVVSGFSDFDFDANGNLVLAMTPSRGSDAADGIVDVESIDRAGGSRWAVRISSSLNVAVAAFQDGRVAVAELHGAPIDTGAIAVLSADGETCLRYGYSGVGLIDDLMVSSSGELWYVGTQSFGRFAAPTP
jgi:hypothetical protein